jgi:hypothetical protein
MLDLDAIRCQGGPSLARLRGQLIEAIEAGDAASAGQLFNALPIDLRRPVEILGMLHLLAGIDQAVPDIDTGEDAMPVLRSLVTDDPPYELFHSVRSDGSLRDFCVPRRDLGPADAFALAAGDEGSQP